MPIMFCKFKVITKEENTNRNLGLEGDCGEKFGTTPYSWTTFLIAIGKL